MAADATPLFSTVDEYREFLAQERRDALEKEARTPRQPRPDGIIRSNDPMFSSRDYFGSFGVPRSI